MKIKALVLLALAASAVSASATVTLTLNRGGFLGETGQTTGITWGVVVDAGGDGFDIYRSGFTVANNTILTGSNDDFLFLAGGLTLAPGGGGFATLVAGVTDAQGKAFGVIWFDSTLQAGEVAGDLNKYGFFTQASLVMPAPGSAITFTGLTNTPTNAAIALGVIPEPSVAILAGLGLFGFLRRRR